MSDSCLYLRNLPRRPQSRSNYIRLLLKHINGHNTYVQNYELPLPQHETIGNGEVSPLDAQNGILDISVSKSAKLTGQCFITFTDQEHALSFKKRGLDIHGRRVDIQWAKKNSLLALSFRNPASLQRALATRHKKLNSKDHLSLKRRLRRLRCKLRAKGMSEEEISAIVAQAQKTVPSTVQLRRDTSKSAPPKSHTNKVVTAENPPNKVLLVQHLPPDVTLPQMESLFAGNGLVEVRLVAVRSVAFVEYETKQHAAAKRTQLSTSYNWNGYLISIGFAK